MTTKAVEDMTADERKDLFINLCNWMIAVAEHRMAIEALFVNDATNGSEMSAMFAEVEEEFEGEDEQEMIDTGEESED